MNSFVILNNYPNRAFESPGSLSGKRSKRRPPGDYVGVVLEKFPEGVISFRRGIVRSANLAFARLFGVARAQVVGCPLRELLTRLSFAPDDISALLTTPPNQGADMDVVRIAGGTASQDLRVRRFSIDGEGARALEALAFVDETSRRATQRSTEVLVEELLRADRQAALGEMAMALAHEINQPLGAIVNFAGAARRSLMGRAVRVGELEEVLINIGAEAARAGDVIKSLRSFLKGSPQSSAAACVNAAVTVVLGFAGPAMREQSVDFRLQLAADLPPVQGDQIILQQIILNLVTNAIQAMGAQPLGQRHLDIHTLRESASNVRVDVLDTGIGLPKELGERIFEPFITTKANGSGLGLSIARTLAQRLGGAIEAAAQPGEGTRFTIRLPCRGEDETPDA
ncbi:PAS domain-containing sensor histidine kinase [Ancylobacter dichloromethanicus]|uniref:histidine kinase n=1 Tax=Ancylobacter dichloromethanicus TaxID=518825 RepID=A0A9W6J616_9HYPH|nr:PAS domain-containing sensor histidine kinase [Ancylobacter dichloromethanicus]GLK71417.1 PAS domain-containing sensor histidine kinase [Ancylobacter dichloromethanicus]